MKTIRETAELIGVSKTTVYKAVKNYRVPTLKKGGVTYVTEKGLNQLMVHFTSSSTESENICDVDVLEKQLVENQKIIIELLTELKKSRRQIGLLAAACIGFIFWMIGMRR